MADEKRSTINIRLGETLLQAIRLEAAHNAKSMNAEIVHRLATSLEMSAPGSVRQNISAGVDELPLIRLWNRMGKAERTAFFAVGELLAEKARSERDRPTTRCSDTPIGEQSRGGTETKKPTLTDTQISEALRRIQTGEKSADVAKDFGVTRQAIYKRAKQMRKSPR